MTDAATRLLVIVGPTAAGKSRLGVAAALELEGEIVSADSVQVYRGLDIGSAKPSAQERDMVAHWCIDIAEPTKPFDAALWVKHAKAAIDDITARGRLPIVVGGTGFYIRALLGGLHDVGTIDPAVRAVVREELATHGSQAMHAQLQKIDPEAAARISPNDPQRIGRALEVYRSSGTSLTSHFKEARPDTPYDTLTIGLWPPREILYDAINRRAGDMVNAGLIDEVQHLLETGVSGTEGPLTALGYRQVVDYLRGDISKDRLGESIAIGHRHYARRQLTWFRGITTRENDLVHLDPSRGSALNMLLELWTERHAAV